MLNTQHNITYIMYQIQDSLQQLHVRLSILLARGNHLLIHISSLKGLVWAHKTRLPPPRFIEVHVPSQWSCICVLGFGTGPIIFFSFYFISCL